MAQITVPPAFIQTLTLDEFQALCENNDTSTPSNAPACGA
jgi:hypothetical protein